MWMVLCTTFFCFFLIPVFEKFAPNWGMVDKPCDRKQHEGDVPLVGGIAIFCSMAFAVLFWQWQAGLLVLLLVGFSMVIVGIIDDLHALSAKLRLFIQVLLASVMFFFGDMRIEQLGSLFGGELIELSGVWSYAFTVVCAVGVINAVNMIDGLDGLAGSILMISFAALGALSMGSQNALVLFSLVGCLVAFLAFNNRVFRDNARVFLGDSGSMFLGLVLVWFFVQLTQGDKPALSSVSAGWIFGLPLMETISVMMGRLLDKKSPFHAGRDHLHHQLRRAGLSVNKTVAIMLLIHMGLVSVGVFFANAGTHTDAYLFWAFVALTVLHFAASRFWLEPFATRAAENFNSLARSIKKGRHNAF